ncbi:EamA family transporter [Streptomyces sp. NPDC095602]|uniref:EamA family transporter n=1 Tax=Streptomyces sp. NPDC095602 TaxID=3155819 RepID=UPI00332AFFF3
MLFGWGLARVPASTATTLSLLEPAVAAVLAVLVVGERLPLLGWAGIALVVCCLAVLTVPTGPRTRPRTRVRARFGTGAHAPAGRRTVRTDPAPSAQEDAVAP